MVEAYGLEHVADMPHIRIPQLCHRAVIAHHKYMCVCRAVRIRVRVYGIYAVSYIFFGRQAQDGPLFHMHRFHGPWDDAAGNGCRMASGDNRIPVFFHMDNRMLCRDYRCVLNIEDSSGFWP